MAALRAAPKDRYNAGRASIASNHVFHERRHASGKAKKLAITACLRKLLVILNAMLANGTTWRTAQPA